MNPIALLLAASLFFYVPWRHSQPQICGDAPFQQLMTQLDAEPFADAKLARLRGRVLYLTAPQTIRLLETFTFWGDRLEALEAISYLARADADAVRDYFLAAPVLLRESAERIVARKSPH